MPVALPCRFTHRSSAGSRGGVREVRKTVQEADPSTLTLDSAAVEILGHVTGTAMVPAQKAALLPTLQQHLCNTTPGPVGVGQLSQSGELGVIVGLTQFAIAIGGPWIFVRIPEDSKRKTPDIYAVSGPNKPWNIELKAVAPLSSGVRYGESPDVCGRVQGQRTKAWQQLETWVSSRPAGTSEASYDSGRPLLGEGVLGGKAVSVTILPDGALTVRKDISISGRPGCPPGKRCSDQCLSGAHCSAPAAIVGLLWTEAEGAVGRTPAPEQAGGPGQGPGDNAQGGPPDEETTLALTAFQGCGACQRE